MSARTDRFFLDSGDPALDFLNTRRITGGFIRDLLETPADLLDWFAAAGLDTGSAAPALRASPPTGRILLREAVWLRAEIELMVRALSVREPPPPHTVDALNRILRESRRSSHLEHVPDFGTHHVPDFGTHHVPDFGTDHVPDFGTDGAADFGTDGLPDQAPAEWHLAEREEGASELCLLAPLAYAAARLATDADPRRIRQCASSRCIYWFRDTSKGGRRRWCSMARCGNREKAAKHYHKHAASG